MAKNDTIFQQDDDLIVSNTGIEKLYREFEKDSHVIHGIWGRNPIEQSIYRPNDIFSKVEIIIGRTAMFQKRYIIEAFRKMPMIVEPISNLLSRVGGDIFFSYVVLSIAKRENMAHNFIECVTELPQKHGINQRPRHLIYRGIIMRECRRAFGIDKILEKKE